VKAARAVANGVKLGRRPKLTLHQQREAIKRRQRPERAGHRPQLQRQPHSNFDRAASPRGHRLIGGASCIGDPTARLPFIASAYRVGAAGLSRKVMMNATTSCSSWLDSNGFAMRKFFGTAGSVSR